MKKNTGNPLISQIAEILKNTDPGKKILVFKGQSLWPSQSLGHSQSLGPTNRDVTIKTRAVGWSESILGGSNPYLQPPYTKLEMVRCSFPTRAKKRSYDRR